MMMNMSHCKYLLGRLLTMTMMRMNYEVYNRYALVRDVGIRKDGLQRSRTSKDITRRHYMYKKEGFRRHEKIQEDRDAGNHRETRCKCKAKIE